MSGLYDYMFDNISRLGDDVTAMSSRNNQNNMFSSYSLTNFFDKCHGEVHPMSVSQPNIFFTAGKNTVGYNGCVVDDSNTLRNEIMQTNHRGKISLFPRPFVTIPYLGKGPCNIDHEFELKQGDRVSNKKTITGLSEKAYTDYHHYPLISSIQRTVTNPDNLVEKHTRGGDPARDLSKQQQNKRINH